MGPPKPPPPPPPSPSPIPTQAEYWESSFKFVVLGTGIFLLANYYNDFNPTAKEWAHEEAKIRLQRREQGLPVEYGKSYLKDQVLGETEEA
jgi:hypothetical protein